MLKPLLITTFIATMTITIAAPPAPKSKLKLGGVTFGMSTQEFKDLAKQRRRQLVGPSKSPISMEEMVYTQTYAVGKNRQLEPVSGAKTQTVMFLSDKLVAVKFHFTSNSSLKSYLKTFEKAGFTKEGDDAYIGTIDVGEYAGRKVKIKVSTMKFNRKTSYDVLISCIQVLGTDITVEQLQEAQRNGGMRKGTMKGSQQPDAEDGKGVGGVL